MTHRIQIPLHAQIIGLVLIIVVSLLAVLNHTALHLHETLVEKRIESTSHVVTVAHSVLETINKQVTEGRISLEAGQSLAKEELRAMRYANNEYFWINNMEGIMLMHPFRQDLEGVNVFNYADPDGRFIFHLFIDTVKKSKEGHVHYKWPRPNDSADTDKVSYVKGFEPWGWIIGSGVYVEDITAEYKDTVLKNLYIILFASVLICIFSYSIINKLSRAVYIDE